MSNTSSGAERVHKASALASSLFGKVAQADAVEVALAVRVEAPHLEFHLLKKRRSAFEYKL